MSSRDAILGKVRRGLAGPVSDAKRREIVADRLGKPQRHLIPARVAGKSGDDLVGVLRQWLEAASGQMIEVEGAHAAPGAIAGYLGAHGVNPRLRIGDDPWLAGLEWAAGGGLAVEHGAAQAGDAASLTHALAAVAETGTMVVASGPDNPVTLSFLPDTNIIAVRRADVVASLEDAWVRVRALAGGLPRTVNLVSGPSRSADIGGIPVLGAHGPRRLCVLVVGAAAARAAPN